MPIIFAKTFEMIKQKKLTTTRIRRDKIISETALSSLRQNKSVTTDTIAKLCNALNCQPGDLMEYIPDEE